MLGTKRAAGVGASSSDEESWPRDGDGMVNVQVRGSQRFNANAENQLKGLKKKGDVV